MKRKHILRGCRKTALFVGHGFSRAVKPAENRGLQPLRPERARFAIVSTVALAALLLAALPAAAGTVHGVVRNGTSGQVAGGVGVTLISLQNGMQPVADTKADARGRYQFDNAALGQQPMLLRAHYRGVDYFAPVPSNQPDAAIDLSVYEPTTDAAAFQVLHRLIALEPQNGALIVGEEFDVQNKSKPPESFYRPGGTFEFGLPPGATLGQVQAAGPDGMPVTQAAADKGKGRYSITFPFLPGDTRVQLSYKMDYSANQATLRLASIYPATMAMLLAPPSVKVLADGFSPAGSEHGWSVYARSKTQAGSTLIVSVAGTGSVPSDNGQGQGGDQGASAGADNGSSGVSEVVQALPPRLDSLRWILISGFGALFVLGAFFLWWKSRNTLPVSAAADAAVPPPAPVSSAKPVSPKPSLRQSVEEMKETLFRLELRRQAGTLSEEEYLAQRHQLESALRDLVKR